MPEGDSTGGNVESPHDLPIREDCWGLILLSDLFRYPRYVSSGGLLGYLSILRPHLSSHSYFVL